MTACPLCNRPSDRGARLERIGETLKVTCDRCGGFDITDSAVAELERGRFSNERWKLSAATRQATERGRRLRLTSDDMEAVVKTTEPPVGPLEGIDRFIVWLAGQQPFHERFIPVRPDDISAVMGVPDGAAAQYYLETARDQLHLLEIKGVGGALGCRLTIAGWRRHEEARQSRPDSLQAFVAMWFDDGMDSIYSDGFAPGISDAGYRPYRVKDEEHGGKIDDLIVRQIRRSGIVVADFTAQRPNVYYEAGFADGLGIPVIRCVREPEAKDLHFDTRQYGHIVWQDGNDLRKKLRNRIEANFPVGAAQRPPAP